MAAVQIARGGATNWSIILNGLIVLLLALGFTGMHVPRALAQPSEAAREDVTLDGSHSDIQFLAGRNVRIKAKVADDVFAAGRDVTFENATVENAVTAGYDVELRGGTATDMIAAAANLRIAGAIEDDLVAAARSMRISSQGSVGGDARLAGETIDVDGRIGGSVRAAARRVTITGEIGGKADLLAHRIVIASGATIAGDLIYRSDAKPEIAEGATIRGEIRQVDMKVPDVRSVGRAILGIGLLILVSWALAAFVLIAIIQLALPTMISDAAERLQAHPWSNLGRGIVIHVLAVAVAGLLFSSIVGIPIAAAVAMATAVLWLAGLVTVSACIGFDIRNRFRGSGDIRALGRLAWTLAGALILGVIVFVPFLGVVVVGLAVAAGIGAAAAELWNRLQAA